MKYIFLLFFSFSFMGTAQKPCGYKDGLQEGSCKEFYENGQVKNTIEWKKGKKEGDAVFYHDNGKLNAKGEFRKDFKVKEWVYYDKNGVLTAKEIYRNGDKNVYDNSFTATFYSPKGVIEEVSNYKFAKLNGETKLYHEDGKSVKQIGHMIMVLPQENGKYFIRQANYSVKQNLLMTNGMATESITAKTEALKKQRSIKTEN